MDYNMRIITDCESPTNTFLIVNDKKWQGIQKLTFAVNAESMLNLCTMNFYPVGHEDFDVHDMAKLATFKNLLEIEMGPSSSNTKVKLNDMYLKNVFSVAFEADLEKVDVTLEIFDSNFQKKTVKIQELDAYNK